MEIETSVVSTTKSCCWSFLASGAFWPCFLLRSLVEAVHSFLFLLHPSCFYLCTMLPALSQRTFSSFANFLYSFPCLCVKQWSCNETLPLTVLVSEPFHLKQHGCIRCVWNHTGFANMWIWSEAESFWDCSSHWTHSFGWNLSKNSSFWCTLFMANVRKFFFNSTCKSNL